MTSFVYSIEQQDKDATNARSAALRTLRDALGLPVDEKNALTAESKAIHTACGNTARKTVAAVEAGLIKRKARKDWTPEVTVKANRLLCQKAIASYKASVEALGYEIDGPTVKAAAKAFEARLIERKAEAEATWIVQQDTDYSDIFGDDDDE